MMTFVTVTLAVFVGTLLAGAAAVMLVFNARFMKWYTNKVMKLTKEIADDLYEELASADED